MARIETGMTAAALPVAAAAWPIATGSYLAAGGLVALSGLIVVGTLAPRLPLLHKVPVIGAPRLRASFKIDGDAGLVLQKPADQPATGTLEIGVATKRRPGVSRADVNVLYPDLLELEPSDWEGRPEERGKAMRPTGEPLMHGRPLTPYWSEEDREFRGSRVLYYRVSASETGQFPIRLKIDSPDLKDEYQADAKIVVEEDTAPSGAAEGEARPSSASGQRHSTAANPENARQRPVPPPIPDPPALPDGPLVDAKGLTLDRGAVKNRFRAERSEGSDLLSVLNIASGREEVATAAKDILEWTRRLRTELHDKLGTDHADYFVTTEPVEFRAELFGSNFIAGFVKQQLGGEEKMRLGEVTKERLRRLGRIIDQL